VAARERERQEEVARRRREVKVEQERRRLELEEHNRKEREEEDQRRDGRSAEATRKRQQELEARRRERQRNLDRYVCIGAWGVAFGSLGGLFGGLVMCDVHYESDSMRSIRLNTINATLTVNTHIFFFLHSKQGEGESGTGIET